MDLGQGEDLRVKVDWVLVAVWIGVLAVTIGFLLFGDVLVAGFEGPSDRLCSADAAYIKKTC